MPPDQNDDPVANTLTGRSVRKEVQRVGQKEEPLINNTMSVQG